MPTDSDARHGDGRPALLALTLTLLFSAAAAYFATLQNIWVDETTQLSGMRLPPAKLFAWLTGSFDPHFGVPPDRMPPVSYLIDGACGGTFCGAPFEFRLLHLVIVALGIAVIIWLAARNFGWKAAAVSGAFLAFSPKLIESGVEIRAYPIFFCVTCVQIALVFRLAPQARLRIADVALFAFVSILSIYTHFFGLVASMAMLSALLLPRLTNRREALLVGGAGLVVLAAAAGIVPFVTAARSFSGAEAPESGAGAYAKYLLSLLGHPANMIELFPAALFLASSAALLVIGIGDASARVWREGIQALRAPMSTLIVALAVGIAVTVISSRLASSFNSLRPQYNLWTFPIIALVIGVAFDRLRASKQLRWAPLPIAACMIVGALWSEGIFLRHASWFVHGPGDQIAAEIGQSPTDAAVVYRGEFGWGYFPTYFRYGDKVSQWTLDDRGAVHRLQYNGKVDPSASDPRRALGRKRIILADIQQERYPTMRLLHHGLAPTAVPITAGAVPFLSGWRSIGNRTIAEFYWTRLTVYEPVEG